MITHVKTPNQTVNNINAAFSWVIGNGTDADTRGLGLGEIVGVYIPHFLPISGAGSCYVTLTYRDITGNSGTILSRTGIGAVSGTTPVYYPVRDTACTAAGFDFGSVNSAGVAFPLWGRDLILYAGSIGSPSVTFSGIELITKT